MEHYDAQLRLREVTQELYDIGDDIAEHIDNLAEAIADVDVDLVDECVVELADIVDDGVTDAIPLIGELGGLRQAFISGIKAGQLSPAADRMAGNEPAAISVATLTNMPGPVRHAAAIHAVSQAMAARSDTVADNLNELADWLSAENIRGVEVLGSVALPVLYSRCGRRALEAAAAWRVTVAEAHPMVARGLRGRRPPRFLNERARIDAVVAKVAADRARRDRSPERV
ncbi:hypothetical protein [Corynebacterium sp. TAE3-ERU12]|uniref:hypothetical protein n=1 Tax=Corynebacterium sp. TAE3-ERU12 TaxID=2849491 RepID=UPI00351CD414